MAKKEEKKKIRTLITTEGVESEEAIMVIMAASRLRQSLKKHRTRIVTVMMEDGEGEEAVAMVSRGRRQRQALPQGSGSGVAPAAAEAVVMEEKGGMVVAVADDAFSMRVLQNMAAAAAVMMIETGLNTRPPGLMAALSVSSTQNPASL